MVRMKEKKELKELFTKFFLSQLLGARTRTTLRIPYDAGSTVYII